MLIVIEEPGIDILEAENIPDQLLGLHSSQDYVRRDVSMNFVVIILTILIILIHCAYSF